MFLHRFVSDQDISLIPQQKTIFYPSLRTYNTSEKKESLKILLNNYIEYQFIKRWMHLTINYHCCLHIH